MAFKILAQRLGLAAIALADDTQRAGLGAIVQAEDPTLGVGEFIYLKGVANTAISDAVTYDPATGATTRLAAGAKGPVAVAMSACVANLFGWYQIAGKTTMNTAAAVASGADLYATATAGQVDDAVVAGDLIANAASASAVGGAGQIMANINRPFIA